MNLQQVYGVIGLVGLLAEGYLFVLLLVRRHYRAFPFFTLFAGINTLTDAGYGVLAASPLRSHAPLIMTLLFLLTYLLELCVLGEIIWNVIHPVHVSLPKGALKVFSFITVGIVVIVALLSWHFDALNAHVSDLKNPLDLTFGVLRMLIFALAASFAQVLGIGWKNKVLQLATALSFYSAVDLIISLTERISGRYNSLEPVHGVAYVLEISFLIYAFTTKDVERREFSPQMEQFLITLAGRAKLARTALVRMQVK